MRVRILSSSTCGSNQKHYALSMLINESVCIDAGCLGFIEEPDDQARVKHVFLTHAHIDHVGSLPIFLENVFNGTRDCVTVHASAAVHDALQEDMFNDRLWPDFIRLSTPEAPFLKRSSFEPGVPVQVDGLQLTPLNVNHGPESYGFIVDDGQSAIMLSGDTAPTEQIWEVANRTNNLKAVFLECSFPDSMAQLAEISFHMTPALFGRELSKLERDVTIHPISLKARYRRQTAGELEALGVEDLEFPPIGETFEI